jgi:hypothetical protein
MHTRYSLLLILAVIIGFASCKDNDNVFPAKLTASVNVINASADTLNVYLNGTRQNNSANLSPVGYTSYLPIPAGAEDFQFKQPGAISVLFSVPLNLTANKSYSIYLTGPTAAQAFTTLDTLVVDSLPSVTTFRFVNASPDAGGLTVSLTDTVYFKNAAFKSSSGFFTASAGQKEIKVYQQSTNKLLKDTTLTMDGATAYTLFTKGLINGKGNSVFGVGIITSGFPTE